VRSSRWTACRPAGGGAGRFSALRPGEWVCAIGNPLAYRAHGHGRVVSYLGRKLFDESLDDYIQTDAAIDSGTAGAALNTAGQVIGINSAISSEGNDIGFAVRSIRRATSSGNCASAAASSGATSA